MQSTPTRTANPVLSIVAVVVGVVLVALGQFVLDHLADTSDTWHYVQHGVLFVGGVLIGIGALRLYQLGQRRA